MGASSCSLCPHQSQKRCVCSDEILSCLSSSSFLSFDYFLFTFSPRAYSPFEHQTNSNQWHSTVSLSTFPTVRPPPRCILSFDHHFFQCKPRLPPFPFSSLILPTSAQHGVRLDLRHVVPIPINVLFLILTSFSCSSPLLPLLA